MCVTHQYVKNLMCYTLLIFYSGIAPTSSFVMIEEAVSFYHDDLPNPTIVDEDFFGWKSKCLLIRKGDHSDTIVKSCSQ